MAWVRYDDNFHDHDKIALVRVECVEALSLHLLANTWTSRTKQPGFVPLSVPTVLVGSRSKAGKWVAALVAAGLWQIVEGGWEFVNHERYRASDKRQTPGTPVDLSEKRAVAGAKGGAAKVANRAATASKPVANRAATVATASKRVANTCSPEPGSSKSRTFTAAPSDVTTIPTDVQLIVGAYVEGAAKAGRSTPEPSLCARVGKQAKAMLARHETSALVEAAQSMGQAGWSDLAVQLQRGPAQPALAAGQLGTWDV